MGSVHLMSVLFPLLVLLAPNLTLARDENGTPETCFQAGECRYSVNVGADDSADEFACLDACKANPECKWFTFSTMTNLCLLFEDCRVLDEEVCPECLSGQRGCIPGDPACNIQGRCSGVLDHFEERPGVNECLELCRSTHGCRWTTFFHTSSECLLYKTCPVVDESCGVDCTTGERRCGGEVTTTTTEVTTTEQTTPSPPGLTKLAILTGGVFDPTVPVLDLENPNNVCDNLTDVPTFINDGTGVLFDGSTPMFCGGFNMSTGIGTCDCFSYKDDQWVSAPSLNYCRFATESAFLPGQQGVRGQFIVAGGTSSGTEDLNSVESFDGESWRMLADLPVAMFGTCLVAISDTVLLSIGGVSMTEEKLKFSKTYFYDSAADVWSEGPELSAPTSGTSCGVMNWKNPSNGEIEKIVVAAGGQDSQYQATNKVEILELSNVSRGWKLGPSLPKSVTLAGMVEYKDGVVLVGGGGEVDGQHLYQLSSPQGPWIEMEQTLPARKSLSIALLIPDDLTNCRRRED